MKTIKSSIPNYNDSGLRFQFFGNGGPNNGKYYIDGVEYVGGEDRRTVEGYQEYKDAGFNWLHLGSSIVVHFSATKEEFLEKNLKYLQNANEAGFETIEISDYRFTDTLSRLEGGLIGDGKKFSTEKELDDFISDCISWYKDIPGVNAVDIGDEPTWKGLESFGQIYKSLQRVWPESKKFYNFFPFALDENLTASIGPVYPKKNQTLMDAAKEQYERYLNKALDEMGDVEYLRFDDYPMRPDCISYCHIPVLQVAAKVAKDRGVKLYAFTQTFDMLHYGRLKYRKINKMDAYWMNNLLLGFGVKGIGYFQYKARSENVTRGETFPDGSSLIARNGEKTYLYEIIQRITAENQKFAPAILNFEYNGSKAYQVSSEYDFSHLMFSDNSYKFKELKKLKINQGGAFVTELFDKTNNRYMYMVMNVVSPFYTNPEYPEGITVEEFTVTFDKKYKNALVYQNGESQSVPLQNGVYKTTLIAGEAVFVVPY